MKSIFNKKVLLSVIIILMATSAFAQRSRKDYFLKPQVGLWFGPITPIGSTADLVDANIGGGVFFRYNTPLRSLKVGLDSSYQSFPSKGVNHLRFVPVYANAIYLLPFNLPVKLQVKGGFGGGYLHIEPDDASRWNPIFTGGIEMSFPAGRIINIGLRIDYIYIYEGYMEGSQQGGHIINTGISLYFNLNL